MSINSASNLLKGSYISATSPSKVGVRFQDFNTRDRNGSIPILCASALDMHRDWIIFTNPECEIAEFWQEDWSRGGREEVWGDTKTLNESRSYGLGRVVSTRIWTILDNEFVKAHEDWIRKDSRIYNGLGVESSSNIGLSNVKEVKEGQMQHDRTMSTQPGSEVLLTRMMDNDLRPGSALGG
ncbi:hypothetical protein BT96DRAFT_974148 [Gymnopus androsaceus JB14]|uniref:Uncharacterized protein n=1 Tax=Gymnopus androsaceus JB14 TaxID=1447944 RepID=A0A6A4HU47_9AGAR|nr:hypothetical protein BT96DRAFT_974148 [Gymnopus androsaceus JB14]